MMCDLQAFDVQDHRYNEKYFATRARELRAIKKWIVQQNQECEIIDIEPTLGKMISNKSIGDLEKLYDLFAYIDEKKVVFRLS